MTRYERPWRRWSRAQPVDLARAYNRKNSASATHVQSPAGPSSLNTDGAAVFRSARGEREGRNLREDDHLAGEAAVHQPLHAVTRGVQPADRGHRVGRREVPHGDLPHHGRLVVDRGAGRAGDLRRAQVDVRHVERSHRAPRQPAEDHQQPSGASWGRRPRWPACWRRSPRCRRTLDRHVRHAAPLQNLRPPFVWG